MADRRSRWHILGSFVVALLAGAALGSIIQSQFNLLAIEALGAEIGVGTWLQTTLLDLRYFAPVYAMIFGASFVISQPVAAGLVRILKLPAKPFFQAFGAAAGLWATLGLVNALAPMPTLIAATRGTAGLLTMLLGAAFAGWLFARLSARSRTASSRPVATLGLVLLAGMSVPGHGPEAQESAGYQLQTVAEGLEHPWSMAFLPGGRALVTERPGRLRVISADGELLDQALAGVPEVYASDQAGLFDVSVSPTFVEDRLIYLSYACGDVEANHTCLARGLLGEKGLTDVEEIFRAQPAKRGNAHYGGRLAWLPDNTLILSLGDGFDYREQAQRPENHIGSIVRLNADGSVPEDNPFADDEQIRPETYSFGHRNVQGLVYDRENDRLIAHEHGPRGGDEINLIEPGSNYGWPLTTHGLDYTGARVTPFTRRDGIVAPALHWTPSIAPSGMSLYRGDLFPEWQGSLLVGALATKQVHRVELENGTAQEVEMLFSELESRIRDVRSGPDGALYLLTDAADGRIVRVVPQ